MGKNILENHSPPAIADLPHEQRVDVKLIEGPSTVNELSSVSSGSLIQNVLQHSAVILAVITSVTYFFGYAMYEGRISFLGLSRGMFPITMEETLMHGVITYFLLGIDKWTYVFYVFFGYLSMYVVVFLLLYDKPLAFISKLVTVSDNVKVINTRHRFLLGEFCTAIFRLLVIAFVFLSAPIAFTYAHQKGESLSRSEQRKILCGDAAKTPFKLIQLNYTDEHNQPLTIDTYVLTISSTHSAFYVGSDVLILPVSRILSIRNIGVKPESKATAETEATR